MDGTPNNGSPLSIRSFIAAWSVADGDVPVKKPRLRPGDMPSFEFFTTPDGRGAELAIPGCVDARGTARHDGTEMTLSFGDDSGAPESGRDACMGYAGLVTWNRETGTLALQSSATALPPVFLLRTAQTAYAASSISLFRDVARIPLEFDETSVLEHFRYGYPLDYRTMFRNVSVLPAGHRLEVGKDCRENLTRSWRPSLEPVRCDLANWVDAQIEIFTNAVLTADFQRTSFALTAGLDTRAILSVLSRTATRPTAYTISRAPGNSLDSRTAAALCRSLGMEHIVVELGADFCEKLPQLAESASRLSGGISSIEQAHEVYSYLQLPKDLNKRLSGNLGNQVGRCGVEAISLRNADARVLDRCRFLDRAPPDRHWLVKATARSSEPFLKHLLEREVPYTSIANFTIGDHFAVQQSPYANLRLLEHSLACPWAPDAFDTRAARLRDLRHRIFGPSRRLSFQRRLIGATGGPVSRHPINWGWRAKGFPSARGMLRGLRAFADVCTTKYMRRDAWLEKALMSLGVAGAGDLRDTDGWLDVTLREFVNDTLRSNASVSSIFDRFALVRLLDEHYAGGRKHYSTILAAIDIALARKNFGGPVRCVSP